jgi:hypothetical protein
MKPLFRRIADTASFFVRLMCSGGKKATICGILALIVALLLLEAARRFLLALL